MAAGFREQASQAVEAELPFSKDSRSDMLSLPLHSVDQNKNSGRPVTKGRVGEWATAEEPVGWMILSQLSLETWSTWESFPWRAWAPPRASWVRIWRNWDALGEIPGVHSSKPHSHRGPQSGSFQLMQHGTPGGETIPPPLNHIDKIVEIIYVLLHFFPGHGPTSINISRLLPHTLLLSTIACMMVKNMVNSRYKLGLLCLCLLWCNTALDSNRNAGSCWIEPLKTAPLLLSVIKCLSELWCCRSNDYTSLLRI